MSGIFGLWQPGVEVKEKEKEIQKLSLWNKAYGEEFEGVYVEGDICLGYEYEKLSESRPKSEQVLKKGNKHAVIDVLLYNREELIEKIGVTEALSDEELLFAYIDKCGYKGLKDVNGDFSGAIYDSGNEVLTLFRDHMGIRPLYYYADENMVAFSTDIRGLVAMDSVDVSIDEKWLWSDIVGDASMGTENTEFARIFCVKPASYISVCRKDNRLQLNKTDYWSLGKKKIRLSSEQEYIERMRELITDSVKRRLDAVSGSVGAELSGGLDSGVIDILIHRLKRDCVYYSWSASPEEIPVGEVDERRIIEDICKQEGIKCHYGTRFFPLGNTSVIAEKMRGIGVDITEDEGYRLRYVLPPFINTLQVSETAQFISRSGARVVFSGHGGDEGVSHRCNAYELLYHKEIFSYLRYFWDSTQGQKKRLYKTVIRCKHNLFKSGKILRKPFEGPFQAKELLNKGFYEKYSKERKEALTFAYDTVKYIKSGGSRNRLDVTALLGAYSGARYIVPYLDYRVVDYAVSIPRRLYLKNQTNRYIFREAFKDLMPESLYVLNDKRSNSWELLSKELKNPPDPQKEEVKHIKNKKSLVARLDREYWEKYLDFEVIDSWVLQGLAQSDKDYDKGVTMHLSTCVVFQELVKRARRIGEDNSNFD